jgi:hypothetical protein
MSAFDEMFGGGSKPDPVMQAELARIRTATELQAALAAYEFYRTREGCSTAAGHLKDIIGKLSGRLVRVAK